MNPKIKVKQVGATGYGRIGIVDLLPRHENDQAHSRPHSVFRIQRAQLRFGRRGGRNVRGNAGNYR
jgi:hypothetical protein